MITHSIKHNFLILAFTGPLRSGCTTAAKFFAENLQEAITKYISISDQASIEELYNNIAELLKKDSSDDRVVKRKKRELTELLRRRELKKALSSHSVPAFHYISMSTMLLKYTVEYILNNKIGRLAPGYKEIVDLIRDEKFDKRKINRINQKIKRKRYRDIHAGECAFYEGYLQIIDGLMTRLKRSINPNILGDILQDFGDNIRMHGNPFKKEGTINSDCVYLISEQANMIVKFFRNRQDAGDRRRHHFVIECFRNPYEVEYFRYRYYEFYLLSLYAGFKIRQGRGSVSKERDVRDSGDKNKLRELFKQNVSRCVYLSDIAVNNELSPEDLHVKLIKYYALIANPGCLTPSFYETFMNQAYSLSLRSSCISRQVGAVIIGKNGYVVGAGWNDAGEGQIGCGYRRVIDIKNLSDEILPTNPAAEESFRKYLTMTRGKDDCICFKDDYSLYVLRKKFKTFMQNRKKAFKKIGTRKEQQKMIEEWLAEDIKVKRLEYCRALHAEENALLQSSKIGGMGVKGGKIFTTTFPCELCAKKIYQSGIREIIYTEPYPESISQNVFLKDGIWKVKLTQFEGVKSHSYFRLYKASMDRKELQELARIEGGTL